MPFYLGSFAGGLFNGASSAMSIYNAYQGIQKNQYDLDAADLAKKTLADQAADQSLDQTADRLRKQLGYTPGGADDPAMKPYQPAPTTTTTSGPVTAHPDEVWGNPAKKDEPTKEGEGGVGGKKEPEAPLAADIDRIPRGVSPGITRASEPAFGAAAVPGTTPTPMTSAGGGVDEYGRPMRSPQAIPTVYPPASPPPPPEARPVAPVMTPPSGLQTYDQQYGPPAPPPPPVPQQAGPPAPSVLQRPSQITNRPVGSTVTYPGQVAPQQAGPPSPPQPAPPVPQGVGTSEGESPGPSGTRAPIPQYGAPGGVRAPAGASGAEPILDGRGNQYDPARQEWVPVGTPLAGQPPAPPTTMGRVLGALGVGTAHADEPPPGANQDPSMFTQIATPTLDARTGDVKPLAPAPNAPPKTGAGAGAPAAAPSPPAAQPGNMVAIGDSLGVGIGRAGNMPVYAKEGLGPHAVLDNIRNLPADSVAGKDVILSSGASNRPGDVGFVTGQIEALKNKGAASVTLVGVGDQKDLTDNRVNTSLQNIANQTGATFRPVDTKQLEKDRIHPTSSGYASIVNPPKGIDAVTGQAKPATPAASDQVHADTPPSQQASAPVPVQGSGSVGGGKGGDVAPGQQGDSQQSQPTNTAYAPPVNPSPWAWLQKNDPEGAQWVRDAVKAEGGGSVSEEQLAAHWYNESHFGRTSNNSYAGAMGPMQFMPPTYRDMDPHGQYDVHSAPDALKLGARYLKHLAVDEHFGAGSFLTNYAYWRGPTAARALQADFDGTLRNQPKEVADDIARFYPGMKLSKDLAPGDGGGQSYRDNYRDVAQAQTPDEIMNIVATTGPTGMGMTDRWKQLEGAMVAAAIAHGNYDAVGHVTDWIAQVSHQGALSNLASAYTMLQQGNTQGAAGALARAHAFFPDGSYGRFGVSANGTLLAQQYDEKTGLAMGKPFMINKDHIATQMMSLQNPRTFLDTVQKYEKTNSEIALANAHAHYYNEMPDMKQATLDAKAAQQREHDAAVSQRQADAAAYKAEVARVKDEKNAAEEDKASTATNSDFQPRMNEARTNIEAARASGDNEALAKSEAEYARLGQASQISRELRIPQPHGGYGMAGGAADVLADDVSRGRTNMFPLTAPDGSKHVGIYNKNVTQADVDANKAQPRAIVSEQRGTRIQYLTGAVPLPRGDTQPAKTTVGAGLSDPRAAGQFTTNLAGIQSTRAQQAQMSSYT
jgi:hypothetical protein